MSEVTLSARALTAGYPQRPVLFELSATVRSGEVVGILGPNGSGKSTLLKALAGQLRPASGTVELDGVSLSARSTSWIASRIARTLPAETSDCPFAVEEVVALGRAARRGWLLPMRASDRSIVRRCLEETSLVSLAERRVSELSAGEAQRVSIARSLAQEPRILLCDEPTSHLDLKHQYGILELAHTLAHTRKLCVVLVLHDVAQAAQWCDRVLLLKHGKILGEGPPHAVLTSDLLTAVYDVPIRIVRDGSELFVVSSDSPRLAGGALHR